MKNYQKIRTKATRRKSTKIRSGAKPKTTGITQSIGEVIEDSYGLGLPVQTGNNNEGGDEEKIGSVGFRSILKNPVYLVLVIVVLGSLIFAFKK